MRISVSSWATTKADVEQSLATMLAIASATFRSQRREAQIPRNPFPKPRVILMGLQEAHTNR